MNSLLQIVVCIALVLCIAVPAAESGRNECTQRFSYVSTKSRTVYYTERYTYSCGWWRRCSGGRRASYTQYYLVTQYATRVECCTGWRRDRYGRCSMAICSPSCVHGTCVRPNTCSCRPGYTGPRCSQDIDECMLQPNSVLQKCDHSCINSIGSYRCECNSGYLLDPDRHACNDVNECKMTRTNKCHQMCNNTGGGYNCDCYSGYMLLPDGFECEDTDECAVDMTCEQLCMNLPGGRSCSCRKGYNLIGVESCKDINECETGAHDCDHNCTNGEGNFTCSCYEGYKLGMNGKTCHDIDECTPSTMNCDMIKICQRVKIGQGSKCYYIDGSFSELQGYYTGVPPSVSCPKLLICSQIGDNYVCACVEDEGHALSYATNFSSSGDCINNAPPSKPTKLHVCRNSSGTLNCSCVEGYELLIDNEFCRGEDMHNCNSMQDCKNTQGGFECPCKAGYLKNSETGECDDIDECSTDYMNCPDVQICYNLSFNDTIVCECHEGDINVCELGDCSVDCSGLEVCVGGACTCYTGYFLNTDNRPCKGGGCGEMIHDCTDMETCNNTIGGYECPCMNGFLRGQGVNATCDDIDECREKTDGCHHLCMNGAGNYSCTCVDGYNLLTDNHTCAMPMSLHEAVVLYQKQGDTAIEQSSQSGWLFPFGMICAFALIAAVVVGRKKSERVRNGTDRVVEMAQSLKKRVVSSVARRRSSGASSPQSNIYVASPGRQPPSAVDDEMGDAAVYSANTPSPRGSGNQTLDFDDADVYQVPTGGHNAGPSMM